MNKKKHYLEKMVKDDMIKRRSFYQNPASHSFAMPWLFRWLRPLQLDKIPIEEMGVRKQKSSGGDKAV
jgi:hypothetical protein